MSKEQVPDKVNDDNIIQLGGPRKYATQNLTKYYEVLSGIVFVYIFAVNNNKAGRSILVYEAKFGERIPSLFTWDRKTSSGYFFFLDTNDDAEIIEKSYDNNKGEIETEFLGKSHVDDTLLEIGSTLSFAEMMIKKYNDKLATDERLISSMEEDRVRAEISKSHLIASVFNPNARPDYGIDTDSTLYNTVSLFCDYMNIKICPYRIVRDGYGDDFTINDIARCSHFVVRKIVLDKDWYKSSGDAFLSFTKDENKPILCVPDNWGYKFYDIEDNLDRKVEEEEAANIKEEAYVIYQHLPSKSLTIKEVMRYGMKKVSKKDILAYCSMYILATLIGLLLPIFNEQVFDTLIPIGNSEPIYQIGIVILSCMIGNVFFGMLQSMSAFRIVKTIEYRIMSATFDRIFKLPQKFIESFGTAELVNRAMSVSQVFTSTVTSGVNAVVGILLGMIYLWRMFKYSSPLAWRGVVLSIITGIVMFAIGYARISKEKKTLEYTAESNGRLYSYITGILKIKTSGIENRSLYEFQKPNVGSIKAHMSSARIEYVSSIFTTIMATVSSLIMYYTVVKKESDFSIGNYSAFNSAYGMFSSAVNTFVSFFITAAAMVPVIDRIKPIFEQEAEVSDEAAPVGKLSGEIEINHLDFAYDGEENLVLKDINLKIQKGEFIGIVGQSGCGKSTLMKCLLGFETPTKGNIFYDNIDIATIDKCELRRQLGVVLQDGRMVAGNIYTNVTLSNPSMEPSDAMEILKEVGLFDDVNKMPMGIFTSISEGGGTVSGGQQQRILLARAIAGNPSVLLLDEATSALDNLTQLEVCQNLAKRNITRVMIAHRLSTVKDCDRIYVIDGGRIAEVGNYDELMDKKGLFYTFAKRQQA